MSNKRVFKNTIYLYIRMIIVMIVQLVMVRILLKTLGAENYGLYNLVGGIVVLFNFLNTSMRGATQRFLNYEMGIGNVKKIRSTFTNSLSVHLAICIVLLLLGETVGLYLLNYKLVIGQERMFDANILYQLSIITAIISTIQVPYNAAVIANERMNVFAFIEIVKVLIMLVSVCLLSLFFFNERLIIYGVMILIINVLTFLLYIYYCNKEFDECIFRIEVQKEIIKPMLSFSGWDLYGNLCVSVRTQGLTVLLNIFFGTIVNAATAIATQIQSAISTFGSNVITAFKPQILKSYAANDYPRMNQLIDDSTKLSLLLLGIIAVPTMIEMPYILELWLQDPPEYTIPLARISLFVSFLSFVVSILNIIIHATGDIKALSFISGTLLLLVLPISYVFLKICNFPEVAYWVSLIMVLAVIIVNIKIIKRQVPSFPIIKYIFGTVSMILFILLLCSFVPIIISFCFVQSFFRLLLIYGSYFIVVMTIAVCFIIPKNYIFILKKRFKITV